MKKSSFIITETVLAVVLAASVISIGAIAKDIQKNTSDSPAVESSTVQQSSNESSKELSKLTDESSKTESLLESSEPAQKITFEEPKNLSSQPEDLTKYIENYGYTYDYITFDHLIVVDTKDSQANVYCYQKSSKGYWWNIAGNKSPMTDKAFVGENGADFVVSPGSKKTPMGFYKLGEGFYIDSKPDTTYPMFQITDNTYWVDDPISKFYNQKVEGTSKKDWSSAEHMITSESAYKYGIVVDYNTSSISTNDGSSIFLHCGAAPTSGSIVLPEETVKIIMEWLDKDSDAYIFIV